jgi:hypothetical protein
MKTGVQTERAVYFDKEKPKCSTWGQKFPMNEMQRKVSKERTQYKEMRVQG